MEKNHIRLKEEIRHNNNDLNQLKDKSTHLQYEIEANSNKLKQQDVIILNIEQSQNQFVTKNELEKIENSQSRLKSELTQYNDSISTIKDDIFKYKSEADNNLNRIKEHDKVEKIIFTFNYYYYYYYYYYSYNYQQ
jgi:hypothetical protein